MSVSIAETLINAMEAKDLYLRGHSQRVAELGAEVAEELGLDGAWWKTCGSPAACTTSGKIGIREEVLNKPGR